MKTITLDALREWRRQRRDFLLLNVLDARAFEQGHVPGSHNVPVSSADFERQVERLAGRKDRAGVVYCASLTCDASTRAAHQLEAAGFTNVHEFEGGLQAWRGAGEPIETSGEGMAGS